MIPMEMKIGVMVLISSLFLLFSDLEKESEFQGNPDSNNASTNDNTVSTPSNQQEEAQTENISSLFV